MKILILSSAFSGLTQRFYTELIDADYTVSVELHHGDIPQLLEGVELFKPDLIVCPFLTQKIPPEIYLKYKCIVIHPGIVGDRGSSSLDWAIQNGETEWGVTLLEAQQEMDMGDIWATRSFPMRNTTKSSLFNREVTQAAVDCLWEVLTYYSSPDFKPTPLDYNDPKVKGQLQPAIKQKDRAIDWKKQKTDEILRHLYAADGSPGVLDEIYGQPVFLYNAHKEHSLTGNAGDIIATANHAICRATVDGAIWIGHLKAKLASGEKDIKLPSTFVLKDHLSSTEKVTSLFSRLFSKAIRNIEIDYTQEGQQLPCQEVWYQVENRIAYLHSAFHNGGMSTEQCQLLLFVYQYIATLDIDVIVLMGGEESWSNGIHLNHIEVADNSAKESWLNINAIDDIILQIINTLDKVTISAISGSAGAGGAILALATDRVFIREGAILNPHYKNMGDLYGSEYWTYLLPKRVGKEMAHTLTDEQRLPISAKKAWRIGFVDKVLDNKHSLFQAQVKHLAQSYVSDKMLLQRTLQEKAKTRCSDEAEKALASYRQFELSQMYTNFYGNDAYHRARKDFVYKVSDNKTPHNIALHRQKKSFNRQYSMDKIRSYSWRQQYTVGDDLMDREHKTLFSLAESLLLSDNKDQFKLNVKLLYQHVKEHCSAEEVLMKRHHYYDYREHEQEHLKMLKQITELGHKSNDDNWKQNEAQAFVNDWGKHIIQSDIPFHHFIKKAAGLMALEQLETA